MRRAPASKRKTGAAMKALAIGDPLLFRHQHPVQRRERQHAHAGPQHQSCRAFGRHHRSRHGDTRRGQHIQQSRRRRAELQQPHADADAAAHQRRPTPQRRAAWLNAIVQRRTATPAIRAAQPNNARQRIAQRPAPGRQRRAQARRASCGQTKSGGGAGASTRSKSAQQFARRV